MDDFKDDTNKQVILICFGGENMKFNLAGVVILYNPDDKVFQNIETYIDEIDVLYVIDNSDISNNKLVNLLKKIDKICYIPFCENKGIAYPLNFILNKVQNYEFLLTMDQDSCFKPNMMKKYKANIAIWADKDTSIAVFAADNTEIMHNTPYQLKECVMTSGNIIKTDVAQLVGGFNESLFIDEVDYEFCYRLRRFDYKILIFYDVTMEHHLGNLTRYNVGIWHFNATNHNVIRRYYMARNMLYIMNHYPEVRVKHFKNFIKMIIKIILAENCKLEKIKYIIKGINAYRHDKFGKCDFKEF